MARLGSDSEQRSEAGLAAPGLRWPLLVAVASWGSGRAGQVLPYFATAGDQALGGRSAQVGRLGVVYSQKRQAGYRARKYKLVEELSTRFGQRATLTDVTSGSNAGQL
jgi:hypothetical protein